MRQGVEDLISKHINQKLELQAKYDEMYRLFRGMPSKREDLDAIQSLKAQVSELTKKLRSYELEVENTRKTYQLFHEDKREPVKNGIEAKYYGGEFFY